MEDNIVGGGLFDLGVRLGRGGKPSNCCSGVG